MAAGAGEALFSKVVQVFALVDSQQGFSTSAPEAPYHWPYSVLSGIIVGLVSAVMWERFHRIKLPTSLAFFGGRRFVPMVNAVVLLLLFGVVFGLIFPFFNHGLTGARRLRDRASGRGRRHLRVRQPAAHTARPAQLLRKSKLATTVAVALGSALTSTRSPRSRHWSLDRERVARSKPGDRFARFPRLPTAALQCNKSIPRTEKRLSCRLPSGRFPAELVRHVEFNVADHHQEVCESASL